jgi:hypothetical protein
VSTEGTEGTKGTKGTEGTKGTKASMQVTQSHHLPEPVDAPPRGQQRHERREYAQDPVGTDDRVEGSQQRARIPPASRLRDS